MVPNPCVCCKHLCVSRECYKTGYQPFAGASAISFAIRSNAKTNSPFESSTPLGQVRLGAAHKEAGRCRVSVAALMHIAMRVCAPAPVATACYGSCPT